MTNEIIFAVTTVLGCGFVLFARKLGKTWLMMTIVLNLLLISMFGQLLVPMFGVVTNVGNVFYACLFLATHMLIEYYGVREGYAAIWIGFAALLFYVLIGQFILRVIPFHPETSLHLRSAFATIPRTAFASLFAYLIVQHLNVWTYATLRRWTGGRRLWLRDTLSNAIGQAADSLIFFTIAFYGILTNADLAAAILAGFALRLAVGGLGTVFMYLSRFVESEDASHVAAA